MLVLSRVTGKTVELSCDRAMIVKKRYMESKYSSLFTLELIRKISFENLYQPHCYFGKRIWKVNNCFIFNYYCHRQYVFSCVTNFAYLHIIQNIVIGNCKYQEYNGGWGDWEQTAKNGKCVTETRKTKFTKEIIRPNQPNCNVKGNQRVETRTKCMSFCF